MIAIALVGIVLGFVVDCERRGQRLVEFRYFEVTEDEPLIDPVKVLKTEIIDIKDEKGGLISGLRINLDDGRIFEIPDRAGTFSTNYRELEVRSGSDGFVTVHGRRMGWICGYKGGYAPLVRIPLIRVTTYLNHRQLMGRGRLVTSEPTFPVVRLDPLSSPVGSGAGR
jgi:hypothetical protein